MTFVELVSEPLTVTAEQSYFHAHYARRCGFVIESPFTPNLLVDRADLNHNSTVRILAHTSCCNRPAEPYAGKFYLQYRCGLCLSPVLEDIFVYHERDELAVWVESLIYEDLALNVLELDLTVQTLVAKIRAVVNFARSLPLGLEAPDPVLQNLEDYVERFTASQSENAR